MVWLLIYISLALLHGITIVRLDFFKEVFSRNGIKITRTDLIGSVFAYAVMFPVSMICILLDFYYMVKLCYLNYDKKSKK